MLLITLNKFDPNHVLVNVNKLKPYQFLDDETQTTNRLILMYWEGQKDIEMDNKDENYHEELVSMV